MIGGGAGDLKQNAREMVQKKEQRRKQKHSKEDKFKRVHKPCRLKTVDKVVGKRDDGKDHQKKIEIENGIRDGACAADTVCADQSPDGVDDGKNEDGRGQCEVTPASGALRDNGAAPDHRGDQNAENSHFVIK